jgi:hypothetical protein
MSIAFISMGCGPNESILRSNSNNASTPFAPANDRPAYDSVEKEVENMRTADFNFIFVLRRKDGQKIDASDKAFVRTQVANVNRRSLSGDETAIVIGSNARVPPELITSLRARFDLQDFSKPEAEINDSARPANANMVN